MNKPPNLASQNVVSNRAPSPHNQSSSRLARGRKCRATARGPMFRRSRDHGVDELSFSAYTKIGASTEVPKAKARRRLSLVISVHRRRLPSRSPEAARTIGLGTRGNHIGTGRQPRRGTRSEGVQRRSAEARAVRLAVRHSRISIPPHLKAFG